MQSRQILEIYDNEFRKGGGIDAVIVRTVLACTTYYRQANFDLLRDKDSRDRATDLEAQDADRFRCIVQEGLLFGANNDITKDLFFSEEVDTLSLDQVRAAIDRVKTGKKE